MYKFLYVVSVLGAIICEVAEDTDFIAKSSIMEK